MERGDITKQKLPDESGVYFFLGKKKEILYIGKATSLRSRVRSYFDPDLHEKRSFLIEKMVHEAVRVEWTVTDSVLEAMLLETNLIRTHKPHYNTRSKDDKSFNHVVITRETLPRVLVVRGKDLTETGLDQTYARVYGPFPSGMLFKEALKIIRKLFQFYDTVTPTDTRDSKMRKGKLEFNRQIGLYPESTDPRTYKRTIRHIQLFFEGKKMAVIRELEREMARSAKKEEFEHAQVLKKKIFALKHIHDVSLIKDESRVYKDEKRLRIEAYDVAHLGGDHMVGVMTVLIGGELAKNEYRKFNIKETKGINDPAALREILSRRLQHTEWSLPDIIVVDGNNVQVQSAQRALTERALVIPIVGVVKDEHHKPKQIIGAKKIIQSHKSDILFANAEAHRFAITFFRNKQRKSFKSSISGQK